MSIEDTFWSDHYPLLGQINSPEDLKKMPASEMPALAEEIREFLVDQVSETGGHLASNLGAVELTLAIHRVFSTPQDHLIFDVGHQSYIHKLLTGRKERFPTLRQSGGLSGFPKRCESEHDCFGTGHSSTSISAALGFAEADRMAGSQVALCSHSPNKCVESFEGVQRGLFSKVPFGASPAPPASPSAE